jgi:hypothetical protein
VSVGAESGRVFLGRSTQPSASRQHL